ncbi:MAG: hypothetical protein HY819_03690 [Acidobacteria bacterium]|nr:hypothetical protein [Acidobacteriota bacterium]
MGTPEVLDAFFRGLEARYLILGDPSHGGTSLETLVEYFKSKPFPQIEGSSGGFAIFYLIVESKEPISLTIKPEVDELREKGFKIVPGETEETAPSDPTPEWVDDCRVPVANTYWAGLAKGLIGSGNFVIICCGTSHVGSCQKKDGTISEPGLVGRLGYQARGYAVVYTEEESEETYTPEKESRTWTYDPIPVLEPLDEKDSSGEDGDGSGKE